MRRIGKPRAATASYKAWHKRLKFDRGPASEHQCNDCPSQGRDWSYVYDCTDEQQSNDGPYCTHAEHYVPRCATCHRRFDNLRDPVPALPEYDPPIMAAKTAEMCRRGHPLTPENTYTDPHHKRFCRTCRRVNARRSEIRKQERKRATWNLGGAA